MSLKPLMDSPFSEDLSVMATIASMQSLLEPADALWEAIGYCITLLRYSKDAPVVPLQNCACAKDGLQRVIRELYIIKMV